MISKHHNYQYDAVSPGGVPEAAGDRYFAQDLFRDILYTWDRLGLTLKDLVGQIPLLLSGGVVSKGTGTTLNITAGYGYCALSVQTVNSYGSTPPTSQDEDIEAIRVAWDAQTDMAIPGYVFGSTNYVKVQYLESNSSQRQRAKKAGLYYYDQESSYQFVVDTVAPTKYDLTLATFTDIAGAFTPYIAHEGTYIIKNQENFNNLFVRTGANSYEFNANVKTVHIKAGTYLVSDILSGGDTWGDLYTNNCTDIKCESGAYIDFEDLKGNLTIETDDCYLHNVHIIGDGSSAAIVESFLLNAYRVTFDNCKCSNRLSSIDMAGFQGSGTAAHNITSKYINCSAYTLDGTAKLYGFKDCYNLQNCLAYDLDISGDGVNEYVDGFRDCQQLSACMAYDINNNGAGVTNDARGFDTCYQLSACMAYAIDTNGGFSNGFISCYQLSACQAKDIDSSNYNAVGFNYCFQFSACLSDDIDASGTAYGFYQCGYGSSLYTTEANNSLNDWIDTVDAQITNKVSTPSVWT